MALNCENVTLKDVAKRANVSLPTASRVLGKADYPVSEELRSRVEQAAEELNYIPNTYARMLRKSGADTVGIIIPTLQNPYYSQIVQGIESAAVSRGCEIRLQSSHRSVETERKNIKRMLEDRVGILAAISLDSDPSAYKRYIEYGGSLALVESDFDIEGALSVKQDFAKAGRMAADYLLAKGHKKIAFAGSPLTKRFRRDIVRGIENSLQSAGIEFTPGDIFVGENEADTGLESYEFGNGKNLAKRIIASSGNYTAVIAMNDVTAFGLVQAFTSAGYSVPQDISVISFDNILYSEMFFPPLTTVEILTYGMGRDIAERLLSENTNGSKYGKVLDYPFKLIERNTVKDLSL